MLHRFQRHDGFAGRINTKRLELLEVQNLVGRRDDQDFDARHLQHRRGAKAALQPAQNGTAADNAPITCQFDCSGHVQRAATKVRRGFSADRQCDRAAKRLFVQIGRCCGVDQRAKTGIPHAGRKQG